MDYNARYYSPYLGRFISPDSIVPEPASSSGWNRYSYVNNNPIRYTDSTGHCIDPVSGTVCLVIAAKIALEATLLIATVVIVTSEPFQEGASELGQALGDVLIPPAVPREQEGFNLPATEGSGYNPGPPLWGGSELTESVLPGPPVGVQEPTSIPGVSLDPGIELPNIHTAFVPGRTRVGDLNPIHSPDVIGSQRARRLSQLSDSELLDAVNYPQNGDRIVVNSRTGGLIDGNARAYELLSRAQDPNSSITPDTWINIDIYTPDDSLFSD